MLLWISEDQKGRTEPGENLSLSFSIFVVDALTTCARKLTRKIALLAYPAKEVTYGSVSPAPSAAFPHSGTLAAIPAFIVTPCYQGRWGILDHDRPLLN